MGGFIDILRSGAWLTRERIRLWALAVLVASAAGAVYLIVTAHGLIDAQGRPLGTDFSSFYAAGTLVRDGLPAAPFDLAAHYAREQAIFGSATPFYSFLYPPFFLLIAAALALMDYPLALAVWQGVTLLLYLGAIRAILSSPSPIRTRVHPSSASNVPKSDISDFGWGEGRGARLGEAEAASLRRSLEGTSPAEQTIDTPSPDALRASTSPRPAGRGKKAAPLAHNSLWLLAALAYPAVFINLGHGQNGFLTASLLGLALVTLDRRPLVAGLLFGLLAYKPQLGLMIPLVLLATGRWRVVAAAAATVAALMLVTLVAFGPAVWHAFFASMPFTRIVLLEQGDVGWHKIQSAFSWVRMWGGPVGLAYLVQGAITIAVAAALVWIWRSQARYPLKAAALVIGSLLATPFSLDYDMMVLAPAIAFFAAEGMAHGFRPWEKTALAALWLVPLIARSFAEVTLVPLGAPMLLAVFALIMHRAIFSRGARWVPAE